MIPRLFAVGACLAVTACGPSLYDLASEGLSPVEIARCDYQASVATAGIFNGVEAGYRKGELRLQCLRLAQMQKPVETVDVGAALKEMRGR